MQGFYEGFLLDDKVSTLNEVNQQNLDTWVGIINNAVKDLSLRSHSKLVLEDLLVAFETLSKLNHMIFMNKISSTSTIKSNKILN